MITLPVALVVAQWVLLVALATLLILLYRQLAYVLRLGGAVSGEGGLQVGARVPAFTYRPLGGGVQDAETRRRFTGAAGTPTILMFTDPRCGTCEQALTALEKIARPYLSQGLRVLAVTDVNPAVVAASEVFRATTVEVAQVDTDVMTHAYGSYVTPLFYGIDGDGVVRVKGTNADEHAVQSLVRQLLQAGETSSTNQPAETTSQDDQAAKAWIGGERHDGAPRQGRHKD